MGKKPAPKQNKKPLTAAQIKALKAKEYADRLKKEKNDAIAAKKEAARLKALNVVDDSYKFNVPEQFVMPHPFINTIRPEDRKNL